MAELNKFYTTLMDLSKAVDPSNGRVLPVIELLALANPILGMAPVIEANQLDGHKSIIRTGLPEAVFTQIYQGVFPDKSERSSVIDKIGMLETMAIADTRLKATGIDIQQFRWSEAQAHMEAIAQEFERNFFYGNSYTEFKKFHGLTPRYDYLSTDKTKSGYNVFDAGGTGNDNTSIWLVGWGENKTQLFYPKGMAPGNSGTMGVTWKDRGEQRVTDAAGGVYYAYEDHFNLTMGVTVSDYRANCRIANIDVSELNAATITAGQYVGPRIIPLMIRALNRQLANTKRLPDAGYTQRQVFYMRENVLNALDIERTYAPTAGFALSDVDGQHVTTFRGVPIMITDSLLENEPRVVAA
jgi:hypothetical protein